MEKFIKYVNKTTLGLLPFKCVEPLARFSFVLDVSCPVSLCVDGEYLATRRLSCITGLIADSGAIMALLCLPHDLQPHRVSIAFPAKNRRHKRILQVFVKGSPVLTLENWTDLKSNWCSYVSGDWLELDNPEARALRVDALTETDVLRAVELLGGF